MQRDRRVGLGLEGAVTVLPQRREQCFSSEEPATFPMGGGRSTIRLPQPATTATIVASFPSSRVMCQIPPADDKPIGLLLSGGLDSCILLGQFVARGHRVQPIYVASGLIWEAAELAALGGFLNALGSTVIEPLVVLRMPLEDVYDGHWSLTGRETPGAESPDEAVYLPGRNPLLLVKAGLWCQRHGIDRLAVGVLGTSPFADAKAEFFEQFQAAMNLATGARIQFLRPLAGAAKRQVMQLGRTMPLEKTFSCVAPQDGLHCGVCNKCVERRRAFEIAQIADRTRYAVNRVAI